MSGKGGVRPLRHLNLREGGAGGEDVGSWKESAALAELQSTMQQFEIQSGQDIR